MADLQQLAASVAILTLVLSKRRRRRRNRSVWVREWVSSGKRQEYGAYHQLLSELRLGDLATYTNFLRMDASTFEELLGLVAPHITYRDTHLRQAISPGERLAVTLRFLATGESYTSLQYLYRIPRQTIGKIVPQTCSALSQVLTDYIKFPKTEAEWRAIAHDYETQWNFPHCLGSMDGKHIIIRPPASSGSYYFNYKHTFSIVLLAVVDANYKFIYIDVGCNGRISDGGVFKNSSLFAAMENNALDVPSPEPLNSGTTPIPYMLVADDAFPLKEYIQKPFSQIGLTDEKRIFNYRLSRARRTVENSFGILANRFRVFMSPINLCPEKAEKIVIACCSLHNFLCSKNNSKEVYAPPGTFDREDSETHFTTPGNWRNEPQPTLVSLERQGSNRTSHNAREIREHLVKYFNTSGSVSWQYNMI